jgi:O-antigen/teichoic acid export membrane protein
VKLALAIILVSVGLGALGLTIGFTFFSVTASLILSGVVIGIFGLKKRELNPKTVDLKKSSKAILAASTATWIPAMIYTIGAHLGPVLVFGIQGASEAGIYYMAFAIVLAISAVTQVLFTIAYPALSGMQDGRKRLIWQAIKLSLVVSLPLSSAFIFYSNDIMKLFGDEYEGASSSLSVLLTSMLPIAVSTGISTLAYAYGNYRQVLAIGLASNIPRVALYVTLLPIYGSLGAALGYTIGSIAGLLISAFIAKKIHLKIFWRELALLIVIPSGIAFPLSYVGANYVLGILVTLATSYFLFIRLRLFGRADLQHLLEFLPLRISNRILAIIDSIEQRSSDQ